MGSRALGELLLRPRTFTSTHSFTRTAPAWTARHISNTRPAAPPAQKSPAQKTPATETPATDTAPAAPAQSSQSAANAAIDDLFGPAAGTTESSSLPQQTRRVFGTNFSPAARRGRSPPTLAFEGMEMGGLIDPNLRNKAPNTSLAEQQKNTFANYPRLGPEYGRTVHLDVARGRDIVRGIAMMGGMLARNKVKNDFNRQRFHERPGLKRKRLNSERWRARFKFGFKKLTARVTELTRKGW